ncbi:hypothetical protein [Streptomyces sp. NPDC059003]|uniref:hypothetical protein n=1 Tax=Streptomyces sp. NPDC059003 TaxID=3346691 RepID=UPI0036785D87
MTTADFDDEPPPQAVQEAAPGELVVTPQLRQSIPQFDVWLNRAHIGVIFDETAAGLRRRPFAAWSLKAGLRNGIVGFYNSLQEAADAIDALHPRSGEDLARALGISLAEVLDAADELATRWQAKGPHAVYLAPVTDDDAELTGQAALALRKQHEKAQASQSPQWRTLKGMKLPFQILGEETERGFRPANDRTRPTGQPLTIIALRTEHSLRYGKDASGREIPLYGVASKYWVIP